MFHRKVTNEQLIASYEKTGSCNKTASQFGMCAQSVHERLVRLGCNNKLNRFTKDDDDLLTREYCIYRDAGKLDQLAGRLKRTKQFICRQAKRLGLTDKKCTRRYHAVWKYMDEETARVLFEQFKASSYTMGQFCNRFNYDELGFSRTMRSFFPDEWEHVIEAKTPRQTMYRYGRAFEYRVRDQLRKYGYFVLRSPRSGSPLDLVAIKKGVVLFVQCKRSACLPPKEWNELFNLAESVDALPILAACPAGRSDYNYWRLLDRKDGTRRIQPMMSVALDV